ncbi:MAG: TIGR01777 family oxidoreductase [Opitutaceae bacterium]
MKTILVTGASGLIGKPLCAALTHRGYVVRTLSRGDRGDFQWDASKWLIDSEALSGVDAVVHLAGESVVQRWTDGAKARIMNSRVQGTKLLVEAMLRQSKPPVLVAASGISFYGYQCSELVDESSVMGAGFLAEVTRQWEGAAQPLVEQGVRAVFMRTGIVLSKEGGALAKMLPAFKMGLGGRIGSGQQKMSWIGLPDIVNAYLFALENEAVRGPINAVSPQPVTNTEFTRVLGAELGRPTVLPIPKVLLKAVFGEMAQETMLSDLGAMPKRLQECGFSWESPTIEEALHSALASDDV